MLRKTLLTLFTLLATLAAVVANASTGGSSRAPIMLSPGEGARSPVIFLVTYDPNQARRADIVDTIRGHGGSVHVFKNFPVIAGQATLDAITAVASIQGVTAIEPNAPIEFFDVAPVHAIGADTVKAATPAGLGVNGSGVTVGIIDSGADGTHPDLRNRLKRNVKIASTWLRCENNHGGKCPENESIPAPINMDGQNADTSSGHGSHVAGIVAGDGTASNGLYTGVAQGAQIDSVAVGDGANILWSLDGFDYLLAHAAEDNIVAISNSWGSSRTAPTSDTTPPAATNATAVAVKAAIAQGISVVFAAGNDGQSTDGGTDYCDGSHPFSTINPYALIPGVVSAASTAREGTAASGFSSCGKGTSDRSQDPTISAPGGNIMSVRGTTAAYVDPTSSTLGQRYAEASGTSMATPHVSGSIALIQSARLKAGLGLLSPASVKALLVSTAQPIAGVASRKQGAGLIDDRSAVAQAMSLTAPAALAGSCPVISDLSGDATQVLVNTPTPSDPALDITTASLSTSGTQLTVTFRVTNLDLNDLGTGQGGLYEYILYVGKQQYSITAQYRKAHAGTAGVFVPWTSYAINIFNPLRTAIETGTGSFDPSTNSITATVPLAGGTGTTTYDLNGKSFNSMVVTTRRDYNRVVPNADSAYSTQGFTVGGSC